jgi:arylsulfatase A-like enzyme
LAKQKIERLPQPFFLFIHLHQPHYPYAPPIPSWYRRFVSQFQGNELHNLKLYAPYPASSQPQVDRYKVEYQASIQRVDAALGKFLRSLDTQSWYSKALLIVTADHGESFERGYLNHGEELYENSTHVPLLIRYPDRQDGNREPGLVQSLDIAPTILRAVKLPVPKWMEGQPLLPVSRPVERSAVAVNYKMPSEDIIYPLPTKLAVWWRQYKLIASCDVGQSFVYDLASDPQEQTDIGKQNPALTVELKRRLKAQLAKQPRKVQLKCQNI